MVRHVFENVVEHVRQTVAIAQGGTLNRFAVILMMLSLLAFPAFGQKKSCEDLKAEIAAKLDAKGVKNYTLNIVAAEDVKDAKVVGSCDGGAKRITYERK